ncbi:hypothetical protein VP01_1847g2 [Puccinia sorghi]|uniref:DDE Tnp4 domain-containing protein n=1 Tax=Puccinia sorghi TaxID=27349 RepID=A0A0L6VDR7_9BASI|nr:hypothetical protein VP01_1847g2 [Puccinia sorghi]
MIPHMSLLAMCSVLPRRQLLRPLAVFEGIIFILFVLENSLILLYSLPHLHQLLLNKANEWRDIIQSFEMRKGIPQVVDGTHIQIKMLPKNNWKSYIHRKSWLSIVLQCVVDREVGGGGSMHNSRLFRCSILGQSLRPGACVAPMIPWGTSLVGNTGYPTNMTILLPYPSFVNLENEWFNYLQSSVCIVVEQAFRRLKNRFHILLHSQNVRPGRSRNNTFALMILHNLLNHRGLLYLQFWDDHSN